MAYGICYTQSGSTKKYEQGLFTISPDRVKFVDFDNIYCKPIIPYMFTSDNQPSGANLEAGTALYYADIDTNGINLSKYLTYTPPDGYELVSEDHKNDTGVEEYYVRKKFYCEPFTVYYGTAGKTFRDFGKLEGKYFYYKKKDKPTIQTTNIDYPVTISITGSMVHCSCEKVTWIDGTNNGNVVLGVNISFGGYNGGYGDVKFDWEMRYGINENKTIPMPNAVYSGSVFTTRSSWQVTNSYNNITYITNYRFVLNKK